MKNYSLKKQNYQKKPFFSKLRIIFRIIFWTLTLITISTIKSPKKASALPGVCYYCNGNGTIKYKQCYCNCLEHKHTDEGICTRCHHRVNIEYPNVFKNENYSKNNILKDNTYNTKH